ncbi:MAG: hypothetical protein OWT27_09010 [Firmicutes bacterium]|nr:hypothetical protein [Bacillota bacterium]
MEEVIVTLGGNDVDLNALADRSVSLRDCLVATANAAGFQALVEKMSDEALVATAEVKRRHRPKGEYAKAKQNEVLAEVVLPELLKRFRERVDAEKSKRKPRKKA